jgi:hypothetical protein
VPVVVVKGWERLDPEFIEKMGEIFGKRGKSLDQEEPDKTFE